MGLALVIFIAAYLKMSTHQKYYYQTLLHCFVLSSPASTVALHTEKIRAQYVLFKTFFDGFSELS